MQIEIVNWDKYNPRSDVKHTSWFRLENTFWTDPDIYPLDNDGKMVWITLLAFASQHLCGRYDLNMDLLCLCLAIDMPKLTVVLKHLQRSKKIKIATLRGRYARVTLRTDGRTDEHIWVADDPLAKVFANLTAIPRYEAIFKVKHDRQVIEGHMTRHGLALTDMEQVTWDLRQWCDGPNIEKVKSIRGTLATFVKNHAARKAEQKPAASNKVVYRPMTEEDFDLSRS